MVQIHAICTPKFTYYTGFSMLLVISLISFPMVSEMRSYFFLLVTTWQPMHQQQTVESLGVWQLQSWKHHQSVTIVYMARHESTYDSFFSLCIWCTPHRSQLAQFVQKSSSQPLDVYSKGYLAASDDTQDIGESLKIRKFAIHQCNFCFFPQSVWPFSWQTLWHLQ